MVARRREALAGVLLCVGLGLLTSAFATASLSSELRTLGADTLSKCRGGDPTKSYSFTGDCNGDNGNAKCPTTSGACAACVTSWYAETLSIPPTDSGWSRDFRTYSCGSNLLGYCDSLNDCNTDPNQVLGVCTTFYRINPQP